jgi:NitT/TauT family transport system substrate-binding protein
MYFTISPPARELIDRAAAFLFSIKSINTPTLRPEAVMPQFAEEVLKERKLKSPVGAVQALPESQFKPAS